MATYNGLLSEWKILSATRAINRFSFTPAGIVSLQTTGDQGIMDLAPLDHMDASRIDHERKRLLEDAAMIGIRPTAEAKDQRGAWHWRVTIERREVTA